VSRPRSHASSTVAVALLLAVTLSGCGLGRADDTVAPKPPPSTSGVDVGDQPNIVLITSDDQTKLELKWMPQTRKLLGRAGVTFSNMIAPHPNCCPARAQILTGQYAHNNGVRTNSPPWGGHEGFDPTTALPVWLQDAGYRTGFVGKYMHGYDQADGIERGWDQWKPMVGTLSDYRSFVQYDNGNLVQFTEADYYTDVVAQQSSALVTDFSAQREPFFLWSSFTAPHGTCQGNTEADCSGPPPAADRHADLFADVALPSLDSPSFNETDVSDKRTDIQRAALVDPAAQQTLFTQRLRTLAALDEAVAAIVTSLETAGTLDNTVVMFTSDNGYLFGEHRLVGKNVPYEEAIRVPLVMRGPKIDAGERRRQTVAMVDLAPTIAELAEAEPMVEIDGRSLLGYAVKDRAQRDRGLLLQAGSSKDDEATAWKWRGVRTKRYTLVRWQAPRFVELYDRDADPFQVTNLATDPAYRRVRRALAAYLNKLQDCDGATCRTLVPALPQPD
jgi:N-acetylglucosamine-6-sulfatase